MRRRIFFPVHSVEQQYIKYKSFVHVWLLSQSSFLCRPLYERSRTTYFHGLEELRKEPVSFPFEERIKATTLTKSYLEILVVLLNIPLNT